MEENPIEIITRVVLTEKAPFWVDTFYNINFNSDNYAGTYLVRPFSSIDELNQSIYGNVYNRLYDLDTDYSNFYLILDNSVNYGILHKLYCRRVNK